MMNWKDVGGSGHVHHLLGGGTEEKNGNLRISG
jgi:hypothetical protein